MSAVIDRVTAPAYVAGLEDAGLDTVRAKRQECQDLENALSYVRRLLHGRLDIVRSELEARRSGAAPADLDAIIARLPELLSEGSRSDALPRPPQDLAPGGDADVLVAQLEARFPTSSIGALPERSNAELAELSDALASLEGEVSDMRTALHAVIDRLHEEIVRRYRSGDASVDSLLN